MSDEKKHKWWHWWFEFNVTNPPRYRFVDYWWGWDGIQHQFVSCSICKRVVRERYQDHD